MLKKSVGQMYPWVTHTHSHLGGECPHQCTYCYVDNPRHGRAPRYCGPVRLIEEEFGVSYGTGKTIFIEHMNDLLAKGVPDQLVYRILEHCKQWSGNTYVFQSKNPGRFLGFIGQMPRSFLLGTTIETNRDIPDISRAPSPDRRFHAMLSLQHSTKFVTVEPILDFDVEVLGSWIIDMHPRFLNIGADSKGHGLPEPSGEKVLALVAYLDEHGIEVREKRNLGRLLKGRVQNEKN